MKTPLQNVNLMRFIFVGEAVCEQHHVWSIVVLNITQLHAYEI